MPAGAKMSRIRKGIIAGIVLLGGLCVLGWLQLGTLVLFVLTPRVTFVEDTRPEAPDYAEPGSWSALPDREDAGDLAPDGSPAIDQRTATADVFYVHPSSYLGARWNGNFDDPDVARATDHGATGIQATAFNACCAVWAPRYRQANLTVFLTPSADGDAALDLAYGDVVRAFEAFQLRRGADRPFFLVAHSQGTALATRLLDEVIAPTPARDQLVAAYLVGGIVTVEGVGGVPACHAAAQTGCVIAWNARGPGYVRSFWEMHRRGDDREVLCTNPLTWHTDDSAPASSNLGAVFLDSDDFRQRPGFADASCEGGWLVVREHGVAPRDLPSRILDRVIGAKDLHPIEFQLYFMNLRENAAVRLGAWHEGER
jgi:hypothetical protein